jgi:trans-aconitate 2-methyltransferase
MAETPFDIVFSNAALQWVPDHGQLFPRLFARVAPGGALAVQMPAHHGSAAHRTILEVADDPTWSHLMSGPRSAMTREPPAFYYDVLQPLASHIEIWVTEYFHIMEGPEAMVEWFRGTGLRPFLAALETEEQKLSFEAKLLAGFSRSYPRQKDNRMLFPFRRLFIVAYKD